MTLNSRNNPKEFWAITCFFNPARYKNKKRNYNAFRKNLKRQGVNLLTVECAFKNRQFELKKEDAEILIQVRSNSVMWHKECLLNIALENLPKNCDTFAWLDCDIIFLNDNWANQTKDLLNTYKVVQPYEYAVKLKRKYNSFNTDNLTKGCGENMLNEGFAKRNIKGFKEDYLGHTGFACAARREVFQKIKFYDKLIAGGGDYLIVESFYGSNQFKTYSPNLLTTANSKEMFDWQKKIYNNVRGEVSYAEGIILHLWHGSTKNRLYNRRNWFLDKLDFNPKTDIYKNKYSCWEWSNHNPKAKKFVKEYFNFRNEENDLIGRIYASKFLLFHPFLILNPFMNKKAPALYFFINKKAPELYRILKKIKNKINEILRYKKNNSKTKNT